MTVYFNQTLTIPYAGMILRRNPVNISILAGNDDIVLILYDPSGSQYDFSVAAGQKIQQLNFDLFRFEITGSGQAAVAISYPEVIEPSIEVTLNPNQTQTVSTQTIASPLTISTAFAGGVTNGYSVSPPSGYKWELRSIIFYWEAASTATDYPQVQVYPSNVSSTLDIQDSILNLYFESLSVTASDYYAVDLAQYIQSHGSETIVNYKVSEQSIPSKFEIYSTETLHIRVGVETATINLMISYIEIPLG